VLTVDERGLIVSAPWRSTEHRITGIIRDAEDWVLSKLAVWNAYPSRNQSWPMATPSSVSAAICGSMSGKTAPRWQP